MNLKIIIHQTIIGNLALNYNVGKGGGTEFRVDNTFSGAMLIEFYKSFKILTDAISDNIGFSVSSLLFEETLYLIQSTIEWNLLKSLAKLSQNLGVIVTILTNTEKNLKKLKIYECETRKVKRAFKKLIRFIEMLTSKTEQELIDFIKDRQGKVTKKEIEKCVKAVNHIDRTATTQRHFNLENVLLEVADDLKD